MREPTIKHCPTYLYNDPRDSDCPERRVIYAVYNRARLDLRSRDRNTRRRARYFWQREGIPWQAVRDGRRSAALGWLR